MAARLFEMAALLLGISWLIGGAPAQGAELPARASSVSVDAGGCRQLAQRLAGPGRIIRDAQWVAAGPLPAMRGMPPRPPVLLPAHCRVQGALEPRTGVGGRHYEIGFEMRLPAAWNGRFLYQGGGGLDGVVQPAVGPTGVTGQPALARGYAVISTDSGHQGLDASFGLDQLARLNFAYAAIGKVANEGKDIVASFYGRPASHSYFMGCSNGGREAMMAAERFPDDFDGIVAGDPGFHLATAAVGEMWDDQHFAHIAPRDTQGRPIFSEAFSPAELQLVAAAVLRQCDALDGLADGMINDVRGCHFNPAVLACKPGQSQRCLTREKLSALEAVFAGAHDSAGRRVSPPWPYDAGIGTPGWRVWKLGTSQSAAPNAINATLGVNAMQDYFLTPPDPQMSYEQFSFDRDAPRVAQTAAINDATSTFLSSFAAHGGRLLIYQGMSDPVFSADDIMHWYDELTKDAGPPQAWARLFLVPGMNHCMGGPATDDFDALAAIEAWSERGQAPDQLPARSRTLGVSRPLCPYPRFAHYRGGDTRSAASFECR